MPEPRASPVHGPHLVEAHQAELAPQVDAQGVNAEDAPLLQPALGVECAHSHGCWQGGWHHYRHQVQSPDNNLVHRYLAGGTMNAKGQMGEPWAPTSSLPPHWASGLTRLR